MFSPALRKDLLARIALLTEQVVEGKDDQVTEEQLRTLALVLIAERLELCSELAEFRVVPLDT